MRWGPTGSVRIITSDAKICSDVLLHCCWGCTTAGCCCDVQLYTKLGTNKLLVLIIGWLSASYAIYPNYIGATLAGQKINDIYIFSPCLYKPVEQQNTIPMFIDASGCGCGDIVVSVFRDMKSKGWSIRHTPAPPKSSDQGNVATHQSPKEDLRKTRAH